MDTARRQVLRGAAATAAVGITSTVLPSAVAAASTLTLDASAGPVTARHIRWVITERRGPEDAIQATELILMNGGVDIDGSATATVTNPGGDNPVEEEPQSAFDTVDITKWLDFAFADDFSDLQGRSELRIEFPGPITFDEYRWLTGNDFPDRDPVSWTLEVSADGEVWTVVDARSGYATTTDREAVVGPFTL